MAVFLAWLPSLVETTLRPWQRDGALRYALCQFGITDQHTDFALADAQTNFVYMTATCHPTLSSVNGLQKNLSLCPK